MYNYPRKAKLTKALVFTTQQGLRGPVLEAGTIIDIRYDDFNGCYVASARHDHRPVIRRDIPLHAFEYVND
jgi:hypothetical protein